jgi:hypothetical protein
MIFNDPSDHALGGSRATSCPLEEQLNLAAGTRINIASKSSVGTCVPNKNLTRYSQMKLPSQQFSDSEPFNQPLVDGLERKLGLDS